MKLENRLSNVLDGRIQVVHGFVEPRAYGRMLGQPRRRLQRQTCREKSLDHMVMHVASNPVPVLQQSDTRTILLAASRHQGQPHLLGKRCLLYTSPSPRDRT